jgi:hypothetical protein
VYLAKLVNFDFLKSVKTVTKLATHKILEAERTTVFSVVIAYGIRPAPNYLSKQEVVPSNIEVRRGSNNSI